MRRIKFKVILTVIFCTCFWVNAGANTISKNESELKAIEKEISNLKKKIQRDEKTLKKERSTLQQTEKELIVLNNKSAQTQLEIDKARKLGQSLKADADAERERITLTLSKLSDIVVSQHTMGERGFLKLLLSQQDPGTIERTMVYYKYLAKMTSGRIANSRLQVEKLVQLEAKHSAQQEVLDALLQEQKDQLSSMQTIREKRKQEIASLDNQLTKSANRVGRLKEDQSRIKTLVKGLQIAVKKRREAEAKARAQAQEKLAESQQKQQQSKKEATVTRTQPVVQRISNDGLGKLKGRLNMPVSGKINAVYGSTKAGSGVKWNGIMLGAQNGEPVRSIYDGQIVYADWFKGFGQLIIVDHGQGYMSLYSHNSQLTRALGEQIKVNDIIAYAGSTGGLSQPGLYFEVRYNGEPRDPLLWVKR